MEFRSICIVTADAQRLAAFYSTVLQEEPQADGNHYSFSQLSIWNPGDVEKSGENSIWLMFSDTDIDALYERLLKEIPDLKVISPPERKPWGAYSFWFCDPDGNRISVYQDYND